MAGTIAVHWPSPGLDGEYPARDELNGTTPLSSTRITGICRFIDSAPRQRSGSDSKAPACRVE